MSNLSDLPRITPAATPAKLEAIALSLARIERQFGELGAHLTHQQNSLAAARKLLIETLWPKAAFIEKETAK